MKHSELEERLEQLFRDAASVGLIDPAHLAAWEQKSEQDRRERAAFELWQLSTDPSDQARRFWNQRRGVLRPPRIEPPKPRRVIRGGEFRWAVGVTTAPRPEPTLARTLASLADAGWPEFHVFADGETSVPMSKHLTLRLPAVGAFPNWVLALEELVQRHVHASHYLLVQDDVIFCRNVRAYVEGLDLDGLVSLYRSARHPGVDTYRHQDGHRFIGALAIVIPQQDARRLVASRLAVDHRLRRTRSTDLIDGALGKWCCDNGTPLWVHGPSLVQHTGHTSTLGHQEAPASTFPGEAFDATRLATKRPRRSQIGLVGFNTAQGLGYLHRDLVKFLPVDHWLATAHSRFPALPDVPGVKTTHCSSDPSEEEIHAWLDTVDVVVFAETSVPKHLPRMAQARGVKTVCVPMVEWLPREAPWLRHVDHWLAPTMFSHSILLAREVDGLVDYHPWPIDTTRIPYRQRQRVQEFVFAQGNGGPHDRKGAEVVAEIARLAPQLNIRVYSQTATHRSSKTTEVDWGSAPVNYCGPASDPAEIYRSGDVFLAPSKWEGLGLQLLECQAAGMPLVATGAPPMNEANPWREFRSHPIRARLSYPITAHQVDPQEAADLLLELWDQDISEASAAAREWVVANRCWTTQAETIRKRILN